MAREKNEETADSEAAAAPATAKPAKEVKTAAQAAAGGTAGGGADGRSIMLKLEDGTSVRRTDYIRKRWSEKASRPVILKEVNQLTANTFGPEAKAVPYQVVFQATKGVEGGPDKAAG